jgi:hypothetical protein
LSEEIRETPTDGSVTAVSTRTTLVPASRTSVSDGVRAALSTGEISRPSGWVAATESMPMTVPSTEPRPPNRLAPPSTMDVRDTPGAVDVTMTADASRIPRADMEAFLRDMEEVIVKDALATGCV